VGVASTEDNRDLDHEQWLVCRGCLNQELVTDYRITRFFGGSNRKSFTAEDAEDAEKTKYSLRALGDLGGLRI
jgi:hypothetical protein